MRGSFGRRAAALAAVAAAGVTLLGGCGSSQTDKAVEVADTVRATGGITVSDGWVRATKGTSDESMTGVFMRVRNTTDSQVTLVSATSDVAKSAEIHEMVMRDGAMVMQPVEGGLEILAGETGVLQPGGNHVMLMGLKRSLAPGDEVQVTLEFADGSKQALTLPVKMFTEEQPHYHASPSPTPSA